MNSTNNISQSIQSSQNTQKNGNNNNMNDKINMKKKPKTTPKKKTNIKKVVVSSNFKQKPPPPIKPKKNVKNIKITPPKNQNQLTPKQSQQVSQVNNEPPIKMKSKSQSNKDFMNALVENNDKQFKNYYVMDDINKTRLSNNQKPITLQRYTNIIKTLKKLFVDNKILITDDDKIDDLLTNNFDKIVSSMKNLSYNSQRNKLNDIIMLLDIKDNLTDKDQKKYLAYRRKLAIENKMNTTDNSNDTNNN